MCCQEPVNAATSLFGQLAHNRRVTNKKRGLAEVCGPPDCQHTQIPENIFVFDLWKGTKILMEVTLRQLELPCEALLKSKIISNGSRNVRLHQNRILLDFRGKAEFCRREVSAMWPQCCIQSLQFKMANSKQQFMSGVKCAYSCSCWVLKEEIDATFMSALQPGLRLPKRYQDPPASRSKAL